MSDVLVVTDSAHRGARSALAAVRALAAVGHRPVVAASGRWSLAAASRWCAAHATVPGADEAPYAVAVRRVVGLHGAVGVLPSSDVALLALGAPGSELLDKSRLAARATTAGFSVPPTECVPDLAALKERSDRLPYPVVIKPAVSRAAAVRVGGPADLDTLQIDGPLLIQAYLHGPMHAVAGMLRDGRLVAVVHQRYLRTWPIDCGTSCAAVTVTGDPRIETRLPALLEGYEGIFQVQFRDGHLIDINPRVYGSLPLAVGAGVNLVALQADLLAGRRAPAEMPRGRPGIRYRWIDGDLRHLIAVVRAGGRVGPALVAMLPRRGTVHSVGTWRDPLPVLRRLRVGLGRYW